MVRHATSRAGFLLAAALIAGCTTVDPRPDFERARQETLAATGEAQVYDPQGPTLSNEEIGRVLADGLGLDEATRLALLNNRRLQAGFQSLGVSRAEYVQAGLLANPSLSLGFLIPDSGASARWTADLLGSIVEIWRIPTRRRIAEAGLEQRILELSRFAGELVAHTRAAYLESVAAREARAIAGESAKLAAQALAGVRRQLEAGAASKTDEALAQNLSLEAELAFRQAEREEALQLRKLGSLLSLEQDLIAVPLAGSILGSLPESDSGPLGAALAAAGNPASSREPFVEQYLAARADLRAAERAIEAARARVEGERRRVAGLGVGVSAEGPEGGGSPDVLVGPVAAVELPIFDQNRAQVSRAEYELAQREKEREALLADVRQELRAALDRARVAARAARFAQAELLPQALRAAQLAERAYELGDCTVLTLLQARRSALEARRTELEARLEASLSRIELERAAGMPLAATSKEAPPP